jgi:hypothetical protein
MKTDEKRLFEVGGFVTFAFSCRVPASNEDEAKSLFFETDIDMNMLEEIWDVHIDSIDECDEPLTTEVEGIDSNDGPADSQG